MDGIGMELVSFADMTKSRALSIARVFDAYPSLRPTHVGGDPARIRVEPSMEAVVASHTLPIEWLTRRKWGTGRDDVDYGEIQMMPGRGGWVGLPNDPASYQLTGNRFRQSWHGAILDHAQAATQMADLFCSLVVASDAAYGNVASRAEQPRALRSVSRELPGIYWLNYFGPAFPRLLPTLLDVPDATELSNGGVIVRTALDPPTSVVTATELRTLLTSAAFDWNTDQPTLPSALEHTEASPGTTDMPWETWHQDRDEQARLRKYDKARQRLKEAADLRSRPIRPALAREWSTSFDIEDWRRFSDRLASRLGGEMAAELGKALRAVIRYAPLDEEDSMVVSTDHGAVEIGWFIGDIDVVDFFVYAEPEIHGLCDSLFGAPTGSR